MLYICCGASSPSKILSKRFCEIVSERARADINLDLDLALDKVNFMYSSEVGEVIHVIANLNMSYDFDKVSE